MFLVHPPRRYLGLRRQLGLVSAIRENPKRETERPGPTGKLRTKCSGRMPAARPWSSTHSLNPMFFLKRIQGGLWSLLCVGVLALAQDPDPPAAAAAPPSSAPARGAAELEKLVQPIALHPDPLIAIILPASVYPLEIVQAARLLQDTNNLPLVDQQTWDENVKALAKFPEQLARMDAELEWTVELGQAFLDQPKELMDSIQRLRAKAHQAGTLQNTPQQVVTVTNVVIMQTNVTQVVTVTNQVVEVKPADPQVIYVPTYPPSVYYPPPGYVYDPYAPLIGFGVGIAVGAIIANNCDWHGGGVWVGGGGMVIWGGGGDVDIDIDHNVNVDRGQRPTPASGNRAAATTQQKWQPDQSRLSTAGAPSAAATREARGWGGAATQPGTRPTSGARPGAMPATVPGGTRPSPTPAGGRASSPGVGAQPATRSSYPGGASPRPAASSGNATANRSASPSINRPAPSSSSAFSGVGSGGNARSYGNRGAASRGGGGGGGRRR